MRRAALGTRTLLAMPVLAAALALAGCGGGSATPAASATTRPSSGGATATASGPVTTGGATTGGNSGSGTASGTGAASRGSASGGSTGVPRPAHVLVVVMENHGFGSVIGSSQAPWLNGLPAASFTDWHGVTHPSQPNYLALFSGSTQGVSSDSCPHSFTGPNLGRQLLDAGLTFTGFSEDLPIAGATTCGTGNYARKHNPWVDFSNLPADVNQPLTALPSSYAALPTVSFVVPNLCHDTHDCPVSTGDAWLRSYLGPYVTWAASHDSLLVITYDEDDGTGANQIPTALVGPMVLPGTYSGRHDHYTLLRTIEAMYGLPGIGRAAGASPLAGVWR